MAGCADNDIGDLVIGDPECRPDRSPPGLDKLNAGRLVPDDIISAHHLDQHQHIERIGHGIERPSEMSLDIVPVIPSQFHQHYKFPEIRRNPGYANACSPIGRIKIQQDFKNNWIHPNKYLLSLFLEL